MKPTEEPYAKASTRYRTVSAHGRSGRVQTLYRLAGARWYDSFRALWEWFTSRAAEAELDRLVLETASEGCRVLDVGCGTGYNLGRLHRLGVPFESYRGVDLTDSMLGIARLHYAHEARAAFVESDLLDLRGAPERYDLVLCTWVLSHLENPRDALDIAYGLLAPLGSALILTLTRPRWYVSWWFTPLVHLFQAHYVDAIELRELPASTVIRTWTAGMVTLIHLKQPDSQSLESSEQYAQRRIARSAYGGSRGSTT